MITPDSPVEAVLGEAPKKVVKAVTEGLGLGTVGELLHHFPRRYVKTGELTEVERPVEVVIEAVDEHGQPQRIEATGLHARILQHEADHLDGVLMLDRTPKEQKRAAIRALNAGERYRPPAAEDPVA